MTSFLLDQNDNRKSLWRNCMNEGNPRVTRFPKEWAMYEGGFKDPQLLPIVMAGDKPLITNDRNIARDHVDAMPPRNPGIIIVGHPIGHIRPLGRGDIERIIADFKHRFPKWCIVCWSNSIVEITPLGVEACHIEEGIVHVDDRFAYNEPDWSDRLEAVLKKNSQRGLRLLG